MKLKYTLVGLLCLLFMNGCASGRIKLDASTNKLCLEVLREGLRSNEFWPSIHAAEGLTLGGYGREVRAHLEPKLKTERTINIGADWHENWSGRGTRTNSRS